MYFARVLNKSETDLDLGGFGRIGVFRRENGKDELVGSYSRNYGSFFDTFFPFRANGKDLALYSPDYTGTRIIELPSCKDLGGEERHEMGFCPVEYFVPTYIDQELIQTTDNEAFPPLRISRTRINNPTEDALSPRSESYNYVNGNTGQSCTDNLEFRPLTPITYYSFGFVAGCIWGDESTWKVQYLDLSKADEGILTREERFGYIELVDDMRLRDAIDMVDFGYDPSDEDAYRIRIRSLQTFDLKSGKRIDPFE